MSQALYPGRRRLWLPLDFDWQPPSREAQMCCGDMAKAVTFHCDQHTDPFDCPDSLIIFHEPFSEYGLVIHDGGPSYLLISNCPFCGTRLPASGRDAWFDAIEAAGLDDVDFDELPKQFRTSAWRKS